MQMTQYKPQPSTVENVFQAQKRTSAKWRMEPVRARIERLTQLQEWIISHREELQEAIYKDFKKPAPEVDLSETYVVLSEIRHAINNLKKWAKPTKVDSPMALLGSQSYIQYEPKGVVLIIAPWNFPFNLNIAPLVSALAAGNTAVLKPSELTPNCTELITQMITELFDSSEVAVFSGDQEVAKELLKLPFDHIFFTGSPAVGKKIMIAAANHLTSVTLELGGKSPAIIDNTADLTDAAEKISWGKFINSGQTCIAPDYILIEESLQEEFLAELTRAIDNQFNYEGLGIEVSPDYARIINNRHFNRLNDLLSNAVTLGANVVMGGQSEISDCYIAPTILSNIPEGAEILKQEIFGPILPVLTYKNLSEAIAYISARPKPLALYLFSKSSEHRELVMKQTSSGSVGINDCVVQFMNPYLPFGGTNTSGFGKSHGHNGFLSFSNEKSVLKQKTGLTSIKPVYPPYTAIARNAINLLLKYF